MKNIAYVLFIIQFLFISCSKDENFNETDNPQINSEDPVLIKTDINGEEQWRQTFGFDNGSHQIKDFLQTNDGGYLIIGLIHDGVTMWGISTLIKTDEHGIQEWYKFFPSLQAMSIIQTNEGGYMISGRDFIMKTDIYGTEEWTNINYNISGFIDQTNDGGYILGGSNLVKVDLYGNEEWINEVLLIWDFQQTADGGYIVVQRHNSHPILEPEYPEKFELKKIDLNGVLLWSKVFNVGTFNGDVYPHSVLENADGSYIIGGKRSGVSGDHFMFIMQTDNLGNLQWQKYFRGACTDLQHASNGGYISVSGVWDGASSSEFESPGELIKLDEYGNKEWVREIIPNSRYARLEITSDFGYIIAFKPSNLINN
jgi:hypothetical protein